MVLGTGKVRKYSALREKKKGEYCTYSNSRLENKSLYLYFVNIDCWLNRYHDSALAIGTGSTISVYTSGPHDK